MTEPGEVGAQAEQPPRQRHGGARRRRGVGGDFEGGFAGSRNGREGKRVVQWRKGTAQSFQVRMGQRVCNFALMGSPGLSNNGILDSESTEMYGSNPQLLLMVMERE